MTNTDTQGNTNFGRNPYITGVPIDDPKKLIGRENLFNFIQDNLDNNIKIILLHGLRRIGKSSVLQLFSHFVNRRDSLVCVNFDLQDKSQRSLNYILHCLATTIADHIEELNLEGEAVNIPELEEFKNQENLFLNKVLPEIYKKIGDKKIVLLLDEFDVVENNKNQEEILKKGSRFFEYLKLLSHQDRLFIIPVVGRNVSELESISALFSSAPNQEIGLLDELSAKRLITKPAEGVLIYEQEAIDEIYKLCAGHPYFTQVICSDIFRQAAANNKRKVTRTDVKAIIDQSIEAAQGGLAWFWDGLSIPQQVIFSAVAEAQKRAGDSLPDKGPIEILKEHGVTQTEELIQAVDQLFQKNWLDNTKRKVKVELVQCWVKKKYSIKQEIKRLENLNSGKIEPFVKKADELRQSGKNNDALHIYNTILVFNPNHYTSLLNLAQLNLEIANFDESIEFYERAYKFDPEANKQGFIDALKNYGNHLRLQENLYKAQVQFELVLDYEDRISERNQIEEIIKEIKHQIAAKSSQSLVNNSDESTTIKNNHNIYQLLSRTRNFSLTRVAAIVTIFGFIALVILLFNRLSTPCPQGQKKISFGFFCEKSEVKNPTLPNSINISNGEDILFSNITNSNPKYRISRQEGVEAYKYKQYTTAKQHFQNARQANINDPEVLIYQNNALARENGKPFIFAVAVPVNNAQSIAQEILRGVAQAQNQFNADGGYQGRLLEIVIANDADRPEEAKKIAKQLAEKTEILGVIGHYSSRATIAALEEYTPARLPIISPTSTSIELRNELFFRTVSSDAVFGKRLADYAYKSGLNEVIILFDSKSAYSRSLKYMFEQQFRQRNGKVAESIDFRTPNQNIKTKLLYNLSQGKAKGVLLFPDLEHTKLSLQLVQDEELKRLNLQFLGGDTLYSQDASTAEGLIVAVPWFRQTQESKKFAKEALGFWGNEVSWRTATSFDATQAFIETLKTFSPNVSRPEILSNLRQINIPASKTAGYRLRFGSDGETTSKPLLVQVKGGDFREIQ
ncbi:MAG: ABC transporter substrate-binding protein [Nostoc sp. EkiNYC01]|nr:ABC transporter substrate-binding protein [Nostoc sp. EkiNYC01]